MLVKGIQCIRQSVDVEISREEILRVIGESVRKQFPKCDGDNYINHATGNWKMYVGDCHHNGDPEYRNGDPVTVEEFEAEAFLKLCRKYIK